MLTETYSVVLNEIWEEKKRVILLPNYVTQLMNIHKTSLNLTSLKSELIGLLPHWAAHSNISLLCLHVYHVRMPGPLEPEL